MEILGSRILVRPSDPERTRRFYRDVLGLAIYREFGPPDEPGLVFFLGQSLIEVSGRSASPPTAAGDAPPGDPPAEDSPSATVRLWLQVRDVAAVRDELAAAGVTIAREPRREPWGLIEMWVADPDGLPIVFVEIPPEHPLRRDARPRPAPDV